MLGAFANAFRTPDLRRKLLFVLLIIVVFRLGLADPRPRRQRRQRAVVPRPGRRTTASTALINLFSGGALLQLTIFALGIMPYITASIILQLLVVVIPRLEALKKEGQAGQTKITQYTRYLTLGAGDPAGHRHRGAGPLRPAAPGLRRCRCCTTTASRTILIMVITMTAGTAVIMWLGELITDRGIGNGMSILIFTQVVATFPASLWAVQQTAGWWTSSASSSLIGLVIVAAVIFIEQAQRRIPVQYARRMVGRKMFGGSLDVHPAEGEPGRHHPGHLRLVAALPAGAGDPVQPEQQPAADLGRLAQRLPRRRRPPALHGGLLRADHLLHLLLRVDHLQPARGRGQHEEVRRLHPRDPGGQADRGVPRLRPVPHHAARRARTSAWSR